MDIPRDARPKLAKKAVLRHDRLEGVDVLLYPERGLRLNPVAAAITRLCDGAHSVDEITAAIAATFTGAPPGAIEADVLELLTKLAERGLLTGLA